MVWCGDGQAARERQAVIERKIAEYAEERTKQREEESATELKVAEP